MRGTGRRGPAQERRPRGEGRGPGLRCGGCGRRRGGARAGGCWTRGGDGRHRPLPTLRLCAGALRQAGNAERRRAAGGCAPARDCGCSTQRSRRGGGRTELGGAGLSANGVLARHGRRRALVRLAGVTARRPRQHPSPPHHPPARPRPRSSRYRASQRRCHQERPSRHPRHSQPVGPQKTQPQQPP